jgi:hypothetical protein
MGTPTTWRNCILSKPHWKELNFMVEKGAKRFRAVPFHSIPSSGTRRRSPSGRWRERRPALIQFVSSPTINSVRSIACELRRTSRRVVRVQ